MCHEASILGSAYRHIQYSVRARNSKKPKEEEWRLMWDGQRRAERVTFLPRQESKGLQREFRDMQGLLSLSSTHSRAQTTNRKAESVI